jgi:methyl-accepting chemotaxis protein
MSRLSKLSVRARLWLLIGAISLLLVGQCTAGLVEAVGRAQVEMTHAMLGILLHGVTLLAALILGVTGLVLCDRWISRPIRTMTEAMRQLAQGDMEVPIPGCDRTDEIGAMSLALQVFRDEMRRAEAVSALAAAERAADEAERALFAKRQTQALQALGDGLAHLAEGNLAFGIGPGLAADYELMRREFNSTVGALRTTVEDVIAHSDVIALGTGEIASAADDLAVRTQMHASRLSGTLAALENLGGLAEQARDGTDRAHSMADRATERLRTFDHVVRKTATAMDAITGTSRQIGQIIGLIDEIAFQTNLLALNAGIEAARAGDSGRGFAVIASEVRALAQRVTDAARDIKSLVSTSMQAVEHGVSLVGETGEVLGHVAAEFHDIRTAIGAIATVAHAQSQGLALLSTNVSQMEQVTQHSAAMVEQSTVATHALFRETEALSRAMSRFRLEQDVALREAA